MRKYAAKKKKKEEKEEEINEISTYGCNNSWSELMVSLLISIEPVDDREV